MYRSKGISIEEILKEILKESYNSILILNVVTNLRHLSDDLN